MSDSGSNQAGQVLEATTIPFQGGAVAGGKLADAMAKAQAEFLTVPKTKTATIKSERTGATFTYTYADLADILGMALPRLSKHGLAFSQPLRRVNNKLYLTSELRHVSGETLRSDGLEISEIGADPRSFGIKLSYFRRYDASSFLAIVADDDMDIPDGIEPGAVRDAGVAGLRRPVVGQTGEQKLEARSQKPEEKATAETQSGTEKVVPAQNPEASAAQTTAPTPKQMATEIQALLREKKVKQSVGGMIAAFHGKAKIGDVADHDKERAVTMFYEILGELGKEQFVVQWADEANFINAARGLAAKATA